MDKKKILVVEDEKAIADILVFNLQREGYDTLAAYDGAEGLRCALYESPDLILLDVMLPEMDGFEVCRRVREQSDVPIIMLTAREEEADKVMGLELGADDYITKPFSMRELMARVKANMRRTVPAELHEKPQPEADDGLRISRSSGMVYKNGRALELSARGLARTGVLARGADGAGLGLRLLRRPACGRCGDTPPARKGRGRARKPQAHHHQARHGLLFRGKLSFLARNRMEIQTEILLCRQTDFNPTGVSFCFVPCI